MISYVSRLILHGDNKILYIGKNKYLSQIAKKYCLPKSNIIINQIRNNINKPDFNINNYYTDSKYDIIIIPNFYQKTKNKHLILNQIKSKMKLQSHLLISSKENIDNSKFRELLKNNGLTLIHINKTKPLTFRESLQSFWYFVNYFIKNDTIYHIVRKDMNLKKNSILWSSEFDFNIYFL